MNEFCETEPVGKILDDKTRRTAHLLPPREAGVPRTDRQRRCDGRERRCADWSARGRVASPACIPLEIGGTSSRDTF